MKNLHTVIASVGVACVLGLLQACGGGGSAGLPAISVGSPSPLPSSAIESGGANIDHAGLINYYAGTYGASDDLTSNKDFVLFVAGDDGPLNVSGNEARYVIVRGMIGGESGPAIVDYTLLSGVVTVSYNSPREKISVGTTVTLAAYNHIGTYPANITNSRVGTKVTFVVMTNGVSVVGATVPLVVSSGYSYNAYSSNDLSAAISINASTTVTSIATRINHFISAQYVALLYQNGANDNVNQWDAFRSAFLFGALTPTQNLPTSGTVGYAIDHALGSYRDGGDGSKSRVLVGSGFLSANFSGQLHSNTRTYKLVSLNLDMNDHLGNDFVNITASALRLQDGETGNSLNQFYDSGNQPSVIDMDYATGTGLTDIVNGNASSGVNFSGSFYGPNAEEVGGGLCAPCGNGDIGSPDGNTTTNDFLSIGFIGKKQ